MADCLQVSLMLDVAAFGVFGAKKFPARRQIVKKRAHLDLRSRGCTSVARDFELAAIDNDFGSGNRVSLTCRQAKSGHTGNARQRLAPKSQRSDRLERRGRSDLAGRIWLQSNKRSLL